MARTSTRTVDRIEAVAELISDGHGLTPDVSPKNSRYASRVRFAAMDGGFVAASVSEWKEVRIIHRTGAAKSRASSQAARPAAVLLRVGSMRDLPRAECGRCSSAVRAGQAVLAGCGRGEGAHRAASFLKSEKTVRRAKVATMMVPMTTTTPAAEARPYSLAK